MDPLDTASLRERAASAIRGWMAAGVIEVGQIYPVQHFASRLGVSATPVREALIDLSKEGLVEAVRNRGFRIPPITEEDLDEILELRLMLEVPAVLIAAKRISSEEAETCRDLAAAATECGRAGDVLGFLDFDRRFHLRLLASGGNRRLVETVRRLRDEARLHGLRDLPREELEVSALEHESLIDAVGHGDGETAAALMRRHLQHTRGIWVGRPEENAVSSKEMRVQ